MYRPEKVKGLRRVLKLNTIKKHIKKNLSVSQMVTDSNLGFSMTTPTFISLIWLWFLVLYFKILSKNVYFYISKTYFRDCQAVNSAE